MEHWVHWMKVKHFRVVFSVDASLTPFFTLLLTFFILMEPLNHASITIQIKAATWCLQIKVFKYKTTYHNEDKRQQSWSDGKLIYVSRFFYILLSKWVILPSYSTLIIIYFTYFNNHIFYLKKLLLLSNSVPFIISVKILQMPYVLVNFLLEVDDLLSWIVDEVTVVVEKVGAEDILLLYFPDIGIKYNIIL